MDREREIQFLVTRAVRRADRDFQKVGGSSRHWVRDFFLPYVHQEGIELRKVDGKGFKGSEGPDTWGDK